MGSFFSRLFDAIVGLRQHKIVIVGLNNAGKTTILYALQLGKFIETCPTVGGNVEEFDYKNTKFLAWDLGGQDSLRESWPLYYEEADAVIFVVDSTDVGRFAVAREELHRVLSADALADAAILVFANKQDVIGAMTPERVLEALRLEDVSNRSWTLQGCSAATGRGLTEGLSWVVETIARKKSSH